MTKARTRDVLLETGLAFLRGSGYHASGLQDILRAANVPKGSFYHYFESKEDFARAVVARYVEHAAERRAAVLADTSVPALARVRRLFESDFAALALTSWRGGCLLGNFSLELADHNEPLRLAISAGFTRWEADLVGLFEEAERAGALPAGWTAPDLAAFCLNAWEGAILRARAEGSDAPLRLFLDVALGRLLSHP